MPVECSPAAPSAVTMPGRSKKLHRRRCQRQRHRCGVDKAQIRPSIVLYLDAVVIGVRRLCAQRAHTMPRRAPRAFRAQSPVLPPFLLACMTCRTRETWILLSEKSWQNVTTAQWSRPGGIHPRISMCTKQRLRLRILAILASSASKPIVGTLNQNECGALHGVVGTAAEMAARLVDLSDARLSEQGRRRSRRYPHTHKSVARVAFAVTDIGQTQ